MWETLVGYAILRLLLIKDPGAERWGLGGVYILAWEERVG